MALDISFQSLLVGSSRCNVFGGVEFPTAADGMQVIHKITVSNCGLSKASRVTLGSVADSAVEVPAVLIMLHGLVAPAGILVFVRYAVVMQIMIVLVGVTFVTVRMRYAIVVQEVIYTSVTMMIIIVRVRCTSNYRKAECEPCDHNKLMLRHPDLLVLLGMQRCV